MEKLILLVVGLISAVTCSELTVVSSPKSIVFKGSSDVASSTLSEVFAASLGYSVYSAESWDALEITDPFNTAKAVVSIVVEDADDLSFDDAKKFNVVGEEGNFEELIYSKVSEHSHLAVNIDLVNRNGDSITTSIGDIEKAVLEKKPQFLKNKDKGDKEFLDELALLSGLVDIIPSMKVDPSFINVRISMKSISKSPSARSEANKLLVSTINKLNEAVQKAYDNNALVTVTTVNVHHQQVHRRSKRATEDPYNLAKLSSQNYPVIFNIIFWFSLILIFALIAISLALSNVEDKDSIIYRMTGARGKKDN